MAIRERIVLAFALAGAWAASGMADAAAQAATGGASRPTHGRSAQLQLRLGSGVYRCELGRRVEVMRDQRDPGLIHVAWNGRRYGMTRRHSYSGLPRYEDGGSGMVWIDLPWKGMLLDSRSGRPLASECAL